MQKAFVLRFLSWLQTTRDSVTMPDKTSSVQTPEHTSVAPSQSSAVTVVADFGNEDGPATLRLSRLQMTPFKKGMLLGLFISHEVV